MTYAGKHAMTAKALRRFAPLTFVVHVRYRTNSGCNTTDVRVCAANMPDAIRLATSKVRKRRGVIRIDGGDCFELWDRERNPL